MYRKYRAMYRKTVTLVDFFMFAQDKCRPKYIKAF